MISGLFFRNVEKVKDVLPKMLKRARTLFVPYVIAAVLVPLSVFVVSMVPQAAQHLNKDWLSFLDLQLGDAIRGIFWKMPGSGLPYAGHLWYLRDLIVIVALSPVIQWLRMVIGSVRTMLLLFLLTYLPLDLSIFTSMFWFCAGDALLRREPA